MVYRRVLLSVVLCVLLGCSQVSIENKKVYEQGYRLGVKEQIQRVASAFQGGDFPYYHWASPMVQDVNVPGHIGNGVFIPEHKELVIIKPGEWAKSPAYPIQSKEVNYEQSVNKNDMSVVDITHVPNGHGQ